MFYVLSTGGSFDSLIEAESIQDAEVVAVRRLVACGHEPVYRRHFVHKTDLQDLEAVDYGTRRSGKDGRASLVRKAPHTKANDGWLYIEKDRADAVSDWNAFLKAAGDSEYYETT